MILPRSRAVDEQRHQGYSIAMPKILRGFWGKTDVFIWQIVGSLFCSESGLDSGVKLMCSFGKL